MKRRLPAIILAFAMTLTVCTARVYSQTAEAAETDSPEIAIQVSDEGSLDLSNDIPESSVTDTVNERSPNDSEDTTEESAAETEPSVSENESSDDVVETDGTEEADEAEEAENAVPTDAEIEEDEQEAALRNAAPPTVTDEYCVLSGDALGNAYHRLTKTQVAENGFTYIKLTPTSDSLIPKVDRYSLNIGMGEYSFMKVLYKTTYADGVLSFNMISGVNLSGVYTFAPPETDKWIGAVIPISTNPDSVLKQYHFSVFGDAKANELEDEEFCLGYIGFFKDFDTAHSYMNELSEIDDSVESIDNVVIRGEELCGIAFDPDGVLEFNEEPQDGALKMTFTRKSTVGKAEIDTTKLVRKYLDKSKFGYVAVRYKYSFADPSRTYTSSLREGYSASATNHSLFVLPKNKNGEWITSIAGIEWGSADGAGNILTFHPIRGGDNAEIGDYLLLDYIGFFKTPDAASTYCANYNNKSDTYLLFGNDIFDSLSDSDVTNCEVQNMDGVIRLTSDTGSSEAEVRINVNDITCNYFGKEFVKYVKVRFKVSEDTKLYITDESVGTKIKELIQDSEPNIWNEQVYSVNLRDLGKPTFTLRAEFNSENSYAEVEYVAFFEKLSDALRFNALDRDSVCLSVSASGKISIGNLPSTDNPFGAESVDVNPARGNPNLLSPELFTVSYANGRGFIFWKDGAKWYFKPSVVQGTPDYSISKIVFCKFDTLDKKLIYEIEFDCF